jgi:hypothetical protein
MILINYISCGCGGDHPPWYCYHPQWCKGYWMPMWGQRFGELNVVSQSQVVVVWCYKKTLKTTAKPKSFQNKQIVIF